MTLPRYQWQPTTAEIAARASIAADEVIRFDHNTSPFPTEWAAGVAADVARGLNEYPGASYLPIREAAAAACGLDVEHIVPGAGVDELILLCGRAFLGPGRRAVEVTPTYPLYRIATAQAGAGLSTVAAGPPAFEFPAADVVEAARDADVLWLCVPNNPTGTTATASDVAAAVAATDGIVVVDAAYAEFTGDDWSGAVGAHHNVIVLRTLSKAYGLAGARVGFAMAHPSLIDRLDAVRPPGSISSVSADLAVAALRDPERMGAHVAELIAARNDLIEKLESLGWDPLPSLANFVLTDVGPGAPGLAGALMDDGLVVRTFPTGPLQSYVRVTVRTPTEHDRLIDGIRRYMR